MAHDLDWRQTSPRSNWPPSPPGLPEEDPGSQSLRYRMGLQPTTTITTTEPMPPAQKDQITGATPQKDRSGEDRHDSQQTIQRQTTTTDAMTEGVRRRTPPEEPDQAASECRRAPVPSTTTADDAHIDERHGDDRAATTWAARASATDAVGSPQCAEHDRYGPNLASGIGPQGTAWGVEKVVR